MVVVHLSLFGETWVEPSVLFDVTDPDPDAGPPLDAIDVQFRCPLSLSALLEAMTRNAADGDPSGSAAALAAFRHGFQELGAETVTRLQRDAGYVADTARGGSTAARLELAAVLEPRVPGIDEARWHVHVYVGPSAISLFDGTRWPVDVPTMTRSVFNLTHGFFKNRLEELAAGELGAVWGQPRPGSVPEIVEPPWFQRVAHPDRGVCPGPWGPRRELLLADEESLAQHAESERQLAWEYENGVAGLPDSTPQEWKAHWDQFWARAREESGQEPGMSPYWAAVRAEEARQNPIS